MSRIVKGGQERSRMVKRSQTWSSIVKNGKALFIMIKRGQMWSEEVGVVARAALRYATPWLF